VEYRKHNRIQSGAKVFIKCKEGSITGTATNISLGGLLLNTSDNISMDQYLETITILTNKKSHLSVKAFGRVIRTDENGIAIKFDNLNLYSISHMCNYLALNTV